MEVGKIKSSMFMASASGELEVWSTDSRSFAMPDGAFGGSWFALFGHQALVDRSMRHICSPWLDLPCMLSLLALHIHGHQSPCQILHTLMIRQLGFGLAVKLPQLRCQRILLLHLRWIAEIGVGGIIFPF